MNPAARRAVPIPQVLVPVALTRFPTVAAELADVVNLVAVRLLIIGAPFTRHVMATAVLTELSNLVTRVAEDQDAAAREEAPAAGVTELIGFGAVIIIVTMMGVLRIQALIVLIMVLMIVVWIQEERLYFNIALAQVIPQTIRMVLVQLIMVLYTNAFINKNPRF